MFVVWCDMFNDSIPIENLCSTALLSTKYWDILLYYNYSHGIATSGVCTVANRCRLYVYIAVGLFYCVVSLYSCVYILPHFIAISLRIASYLRTLLQYNAVLLRHISVFYWDLSPHFWVVDRRNVYRRWCEKSAVLCCIRWYNAITP